MECYICGREVDYPYKVCAECARIWLKADDEKDKQQFAVAEEKAYSESNSGGK